MSGRFQRFAPLLTGVAFVALFLIGLLRDQSTPDSTASDAKLLAYYHAHNVGGNGFTLTLSVVAGIFFYGMLRRYLSRSPEAEWLTFVGFSGAVMFLVGALIEAGVDFTLSDLGNQLDAPTARVLNVSQGDLNQFLWQGGICILMLGFGIAMLRSGLMPRWLGWATVVIGILAIAGPLFGIAFPLEGVWVLVVSIILFTRNEAVLPTPGGEALGVADA